METLMSLDKELFFFLNGLHTDWMDPVMFYISKTLTWLPVYLIMLWLMIRHCGWNSLIWLGGIALAVLLADQITSSFMKPFFERFRPSRDPGIEEGLVHVVNGYRGGKFGFASSHAANAFAIATLLHLVLRPYVKYTGYLFLMAGIVAYSRIYLGVHYPGDIIVGGVIGAAAGWISYIVSRKLGRRWLDSAAAEA